MTSTMPALPPEIAAEVDKVETMIDTARQLLSEGKDVDLTNLEGRIHIMCQAIGEAGRAEDADTAAFKAAITTVMAKLEALGAELTRRHEARTAAEPDPVNTTD